MWKFFSTNLWLRNHRLCCYTVFSLRGKSYFIFYEPNFPLRDQTCINMYQACISICAQSKLRIGQMWNFFSFFPFFLSFLFLSFFLPFLPSFLPIFLSFFLSFSFQKRQWHHCGGAGALGTSRSLGNWQEPISVVVSRLSHEASMGNSCDIDRENSGTSWATNPFL